MDHNTREQRRREMEVRVMEPHADIATSPVARTPQIGSPIIDSLAPTPPASASIGQGHRARFPGGTRGAVEIIEIRAS